MDRAVRVLALVCFVNAALWPDERKALFRELYDSGLTMEEIAKKLTTSRDTLRKAIKEFGFPARGRWKPNYQAGVWSEELCDQLALLWTEGLSASVIGRQIGMNKNKVIGKVRRLGLEHRPSPIYVGPPKVKVKAAPRPKRVAAVRATPLPGQATGSRGTGAIKGNTLPVVKLVDTTPAVAAPPKPSILFIGYTGRVGKCAFLKGVRRAYWACDVPTVPSKSYCPEHHAICYVQERPRDAVETVA